MYSSSSSSNSQSSSHFYPSETNPNSNDNVPNRQPPYGFPFGASSLARQGSSSSAAGFLNQLATTAAAASHDNGFSITSGKAPNTTDSNRGIVSRLNSQLNFSHQQTNVSNSNIFKRANSLDTMESQFQFGVPESALEAATMEKLLHIPQDSVACKTRAKRGFATHPRSIAERERRTRISGKLKKLQDLVPNMDKQTSYSDMLDLAVQHIKCLQDQVQKLNEEMDSCTCGCIKKDGRTHH